LNKTFDIDNRYLKKPKVIAGLICQALIRCQKYSREPKDSIKLNIAIRLSYFNYKLKMRDHLLQKKYIFTSFFKRLCYGITHPLKETLHVINCAGSNICKEVYRVVQVFIRPILQEQRSEILIRAYTIRKRKGRKRVEAHVLY